VHLVAYEKNTISTTAISNYSLAAIWLGGAPPKSRIVLGEK